MHGGQLSFDPVSGHGFGKPRSDDHYGWWYDEHAQIARSTAGAGTGRAARLAVGSLAIRDGYRSAHQAARSALRCVIGSAEYQHYTGQDLIRSRKRTVDGQQGWEMITDVGVRPVGDGATGDRIRLLVVDAGAPGSFSIFVGVSPLGDSRRTKIVNATVADLRIGY
ncbi:hypothetical protein SAMN04489812_1127 [Microlunatus soli]|uniref:Uncharacterized protein n=1 Tax=Microlunatus soli TaxID=630515 RepID=A0A1H1Q3J9_9ACTN|nr:hypothetical protein SAMN04489812_1127 [Microlunatus soli]